MTDLYFRSKVMLIKSRLSEIKKRQFEHQRQSVRLGYLHQYSKATIHALNAVSMTSLIITMVGTNSSLIICAVAGGLSSIGTAMLEVLDLHDRQINHHHSHLQLLDLYNDISASMLREGVTSVVLDNIIEDLNHRSALLYDTAPLVSMRSTVSSVVLPRWSMTTSSRCRDTPKPIPHVAELDVCITHDPLLPAE